MARDLAERCRCADAAQVTINCQPLATQSQYLVCEALMRIWSDAQLPQQSMGKREWETLLPNWRNHAGDVAARDFPSRVRARKTGEQLTLARLRGKLNRPKSLHVRRAFDPAGELRIFGFVPDQDLGLVSAFGCEVGDQRNVAQQHDDRERSSCSPGPFDCSTRAPLPSFPQPPVACR